MGLNELLTYVLPAVFAALLVRRVLLFRKARRELPARLSEGALILDVRSRAEFADAGNPKSVNIPLDELEQRVDQLDPGKPIVLCCASGTRSAMAASLLKRRGFSQVINAGSWRNTVRTGG